MPAHLAYGYDLELCLGIGRQAGVGRWDQGTWNVAVWDQPDTTMGDWVDVTCDVPGTVTFAAATSTANNDVVPQWQGATCAFSLLGPDWDPWNGPYAGVLGPQTPVRWRWRQTGDLDWSPMFYGAVQEGGYQWSPRDQTAAVAAVDAFGDLSSFDNGAGAYVGKDETAAARVGRWLDVARWPAAARDITAGGVQLVQSVMDGNAADNLAEVANTDLALMWIRRDGRLAYRPQGWINPGPAGGRLVVCPDDPDDVQVIDMSGATFETVVNLAMVRGGPIPAAVAGDPDVYPPYATVEDPASVARFRGRQQTLDLLHTDSLRPSWSSTVASVVVGAGAWPSMAPAEVVLGLASGDARVPALLFGLEPETAFEVIDPGGRVWLMHASGWDITVGWSVCGGTLKLADITALSGALWDSAVWDRDHWGLGQVS